MAITMTTEQNKIRPTLRERVVRFLFGNLIEAQVGERVEEALRAQAGITGVDPDEAQWRPLSRSRRDLTPIDQDKLIEIANYLACSNPLAKRCREIRRDFVIGEGVKIEAEDKDYIQPWIDEFINDPVNNWDELQFQLVDYIGINGELFLPVFVNTFTGAVRLGWIDPVEVQQVVRDPYNRRIMRQVILKAGGGGMSVFGITDARRTYTVVNIDTDTVSKYHGYRQGQLLFFKINCAPDATRGRSDLESVADLLDAWDQSVFNDLEREQLLKNFIWDVTWTGLDQKEIDKKMKDQKEPKPGSVRAHNEKVKWEAVAPDLKTAESVKLQEAIRRNILGAFGLSDFYFGVTEGANRASSENLDQPIAKGFTSRQRVVKAIFRETIDFVIDQRLLRSPYRAAFQSGRRSRKFEIEMPEISVRDLSRLAGVVNQMVAAIDTALENKWITNLRAAKLFAGFVAQFGQEYDAEEEMKLAEAEAEEASRKDYNNRNPRNRFDDTGDTGDGFEGQAVA
ncbi:MAG: hypothetical protein AB1631_20640 [Acidobacteriota bacterium]